jgi:hypothetical protein
MFNEAMLLTSKRLCILASILHLYACVNPRPILRTQLVQKVTVLRVACLLEKTILLYSVKNSSSVKLYNFLNIANEWPFLCMKASAQRCKRTKMVLKIRLIFESVHGGDWNCDSAVKKYRTQAL